MTATETKTQEYVVVVEPEYASEEDRAAKRRTITLPAADYQTAGLGALRALTGRNQKTLRSEGRFHKDPETVRRYLSRADREGDRWMLIVDYSPAEKKRIADAKAADEAAYAAKVEEAKPDVEAYEALLAAHPDVRPSLSTGYVRVEWKVTLGDDYTRIEITRERGYGETGWTSPTQVSVGHVRLKDDVAARAATLARAVEKAAAIAALLDARYPAGSAERTVPTDTTNQISANYRAHAALLALVVKEINS